MGHAMISLEKQSVELIKEQAAEEYPNECCGVLLGKINSDRIKIVEELLPVSNAREQSASHNRFLITADEIFKCEQLARKKKLDILGFYHSHPDHPASPSEYDLAHALPFYSYVIVSVLKGQAADLTSWELEDDRSRFNPEHIILGE
jgi:proteasome lid subunit RPN8/RPN11